MLHPIQHMTSSIKKDEMIYDNSYFSNTFGLNPDKKDSSLRKIHKYHIHVHLLLAKQYAVSKAFFKAFKLIFHKMQSLYDKSHFYSLFKQLWIIKNSKPIFKKIQKIRCKTNA